MASSQAAAVIDEAVELTNIPSLTDPLVGDSQTQRPSPENVFSQSRDSEGAAASTSRSSSSKAMPIIPKNRRRPGSLGDSQRVTMTGTVTCGSSSGQPVEVEVEVTEREYQRLTSMGSNSMKQDKEGCQLGLYRGPHIVLWSVVCIPVAFVISICLSFYNGSLTWYNMLIYFSEEKSILHRVTICPILILSFPILVGVSACVLALVASFLQVSWTWARWKTEFRDGEKGFYGWFCGIVDLPDCSPYQVVVLDDAHTY